MLYTTWCDAAGKVRDDGTLQRLGDEDFRLTSAEPTLFWLQENADRLQVTIADETDSVAALALQGPASARILQAIIGTDGSGGPCGTGDGSGGTGAELDPAKLPYFGIAKADIQGIRVEISRTGYTGDLGYEIWISASDALTVWDAVVEAGEPFGLRPAGMLALDIARIEAGLILGGVDYVPAHQAVIAGQRSSPFELGLGWMVSQGKTAPYVGQRALEAERTAESEWRFRGIRVDWPSVEAAWARVDLPPQVPTSAERDSVPLYAGRREAGYVTSRTWSPVLKQYIGLAHLRANHASAGTSLEMEITVEHMRRRASVQVVDTPFFDPPRKREIG